MNTIWKVLIGIIPFGLIFIAVFANADMARIDLNAVVNRGSKLIWQDDIDRNETQINVFTAMNYCATLRLGGYDDWRLPSKQELTTRHNYNKRNLDAYWYSENFSLASGCGTAIFNMQPRYIRCVRK
ncbi:MAG: DUF1566 domain-containing protein [Sulfuricurvum sp.]|jgi:hypothetical protein